MRLVAILVLGYVCATQDRDARLHMTSNSDRKTTKNLKSSTGSSDEVTEEDLSMLQKEGAEALNNGDIATAELKMKLVKKLLPYLQESWLNLAIVYERGRRWEEALRVYRQGLAYLGDAATDIPKHLCNLMMQLIQGMETDNPVVLQELLQVESVCLLSARLSASDPSVYVNLGTMYTLLTKWEPAASAFKTALEIYNKAKKSGRLKTMAWRHSFNIGMAHSNHANACSRWGDIPQAIQSAQESLQTDPDSISSVSTLATVFLTGDPFDFRARILRRRVQLLGTHKLVLKDKSCPSGHWSMASTWPEIDGEEGASVTLMNPETHNTEYGINETDLLPYVPLRFTSSPPLTPYATRYRERSIYLVNLPAVLAHSQTAPLTLRYETDPPKQVNLTNVYMGGRSAIMHRNCILYLGGFSLATSKIEELEDMPAASLIRIRGTVVNLISPHMNNYYHFICEFMVRLLFAVDYIRRHHPKAMRKLKWMVPAYPYKQGWLIDLLNMLELSDLELIPNDYTKRYLFDRVLVVDWEADEVLDALEEVGIPLAATTEDVFNHSLWDLHNLPLPPTTSVAVDRSLAHDSWSSFYPPRVGLVALRDAIRKALAPSTAKADRKVIFISRADVKDGDSKGKGILFGGFNTRFLRNEIILIYALNEMLGPNLFSVFLGTGMQVRDQLDLFSHAAVVIAPHGAGLANTVACAVNTTIILFPMKPHVDNTFCHQLAALSLNTWIAPDITSYYYGTYTLLTKESANNVLQAVRQSLLEHGIDVLKEVVLDDAPFEDWLRMNPLTPLAAVAPPRKVTISKKEKVLKAKKDRHASDL